MLQAAGMNRIMMLVVFVFMSVSVVLAQLPTGTFLGTVKDSSGAAVPGATVTPKIQMQLLSHGHHGR